MPHPKHVPAPIPEDEEGRLEFLRNLKILDTDSEEAFDRITKAAATIFHVPIALVCLLDRERNWFKSRYGVGDMREADRQSSFCQHVIYTKQRDALVVADTMQDPRFMFSDVVINPPHIRFYAGYPLVMCAEDGKLWTLGTLCIYDVQPRSLPSDQVRPIRIAGRLTLSLRIIHLYRHVEVLQAKRARAFPGGGFSRLRCDIAHRGRYTMLRRARWRRCACSGGSSRPSSS